MHGACLKAFSMAWHVPTTLLRCIQSTAFPPDPTAVLPAVQPAYPGYGAHPGATAAPVYYAPPPTAAPVAYYVQPGPPAPAYGAAPAAPPPYGVAPAAAAYAYASQPAGGAAPVYGVAPAYGAPQTGTYQPGY